MKLDPIQEQELAEAMEQLARWTRNYFLRLVGEGFTEAQALVLAKQWQASTFAQSQGDDS